MGSWCSFQGVGTSGRGPKLRDGKRWGSSVWVFGLRG